MARVTVTDCLEHVDNRFQLVLIATKRTRQLILGAEALVESGDDKPTVIALREIAAGLIDASILEEPVDIPVLSFDEQVIPAEDGESSEAEGEVNFTLANAALTDDGDYSEAKAKAEAKAEAKEAKANVALTDDGDSSEAETKAKAEAKEAKVKAKEAKAEAKEAKAKAKAEAKEAKAEANVAPASVASTDASDSSEDEGEPHIEPATVTPALEKDSS